MNYYIALVRGGEEDSANFRFRIILQKLTSHLVKLAPSSSIQKNKTETANTEISLVMHDINMFISFSSLLNSYFL